VPRDIYRRIRPENRPKTAIGNYEWTPPRCQSVIGASQRYWRNVIAY